jgi:hypothetical protein
MHMLDGWLLNNRRFRSYNNMRIEINTPAEVAKNFGVKRRKHAGGIQTVGVLKFAGVFIDREYSDEMLGLPIAATALLYGEDGLPVSAVTIGRKHIVYQFAGVITGNVNKDEQIKLAKDTEVCKCELQLVPNGALLSGQLVWPVRGDEVEDLEPLLGQTCMLNGLIVLPEQIDAFAQAKGVVDSALGKLKGRE